VNPDFFENAVLSTGQWNSNAGQLDALSLPLADQFAFKLRKRSPHAQQQIRHWRICTRECQVFFDKADLYSPSCQSQDKLAQIVQVAA
jgi:hypothetical protein